MSVTVTPETYQFVNYDHAEISEIAVATARDAGIPGSADVHLDVVESSPLGRVKIEDLEKGASPKVTLRIEGGAFENLKAPRQFAADRAKETLGRIFFRLSDLFDAGFGFEGEWDSMPVPRAVAWDVYAVGRLNRLGYTINHDRWLYLFRNRHGFTDEADLVFEKLWAGTDLTWQDIRGMSEGLKSDEDLQPSRRIPTR